MFEYLWTPKFAVLLLWLLCALHVHYRGRVRHRFLRQLTDHSTFLAPFNFLAQHLSRVAARPFADVQAFPELELFRENWHTIAQEARALYLGGELQASGKHQDIAFNTFFKRGWKRFYFKWYHELLPSALALCPRTSALVASVPTVRAAMFTLLPAGSELGPHRDPYAGSLRYHLGLVTPNSDACRIYVDGQAYSWRDGEHVLFDETYIHSARNDTHEPRIIFFADVERPLRTRPLRALNRFLATHVAQLTSSRNRESERLGSLNRLAGLVHLSRRTFTRLKEFDHRLYYAVKYALALWLAYWIFAPGGASAG